HAANHIPIFSPPTSPDHQELHSFPTRRSSDLNARPDRREDRSECAVNQAALRVVQVQPQQGRRHAADQVREEKDDAKPFGPPDADRKSTRLNSSHVKISYAVFCLKKKKKEKKQ